MPRISLGPVLPPRKHLAVSGDIFACNSWVGGATGFEWVETRDAGQCPTMYETGPYDKELSSPNVSIVPRLRDCLYTVYPISSLSSSPAPVPWPPPLSYIGLLCAPNMPCLRAFTLASSSSASAWLAHSTSSRPLLKCRLLNRI